MGGGRIYRGSISPLRELGWLAFVRQLPKSRLLSVLLAS